MKSTNIIVVCAIVFTYLLLSRAWEVYQLNSGKSDGVLCIHKEDIDRSQLGISFIPDEGCYGYTFPQTDFVEYSWRTSGNKGKLEILLGDGFGEWLNGREIKLEESHAFYDLHYRNLLERSRKYHDEIFDNNLNWLVYMDVDALTSARILNAFNVGEGVSFPFHISCFFSSSATDGQCHIWFPYNSVVYVSVLVAYSDLENVDVRARELHGIVENLMNNEI